MSNWNLGYEIKGERRSDSWRRITFAAEKFIHSPILVSRVIVPALAFYSALCTALLQRLKLDECHCQSIHIYAEVGFIWTSRLDRRPSAVLTHWRKRLGGCAANCEVSLTCSHTSGHILSPILQAFNSAAPVGSFALQLVFSLMVANIC